MNFNSLKAICMLIFSFSIVPCLSAQQSSTSEYQLATHVIFSYSNGAKLEARVEQFDTTKHDIVCVDRVLRMIDGSPYFGTDGTLPRTQFQSLVFYLDDTSVPLETSGLFDPWGYTKPHEQIIARPMNDYWWCVTGVFSDGAGCYGAQLVIGKTKSLRTQISDCSEDLKRLYKNEIEPFTNNVTISVLEEEPIMVKGFPFCE